jgi:acetyl esterase/lipase
MYRTLNDQLRIVEGSKKRWPQHDLPQSEELGISKASANGSMDMDQPQRAMASRCPPRRNTLDRRRDTGRPWGTGFSTMLRLLVLSVLAFATAARAAPSPPSEPLSAEELFRAATLGEARLSPDGQHMGVVVADQGDSRSLVIYDLKDYKPTGLRGAGSLDVSTFQWMGNDKLVFSVTQDKLYAWGLYSARLGRISDYTPIDTYDVTQIIGFPEARPGRVLVWCRSTVGGQIEPGDVVEMDADYKPFGSELPRRGDAIVRRLNPPKEGRVVFWASDHRGELALCETWSRGRYHFYRYAPGPKTWGEVPIHADARPMGMDYDDRYAWVVTVSPDVGYALRRCNLGSGALEEPVLTDPSYDIGTGGLHYSDAARRLAGVTYVQRKPVSAWFLRDYAVAQATMNKLRPSTDNVLVDHDSADKKFLFELTGPQHPGAHELLDMEAKTVRSLGDAAPWLKGRPLHPVVPITFHTRDGARLEGYEALPDGASTAHPVPLVILAHGGPWARDTALFNPVVQFLVSRGYAVLQPNYRGSSGYVPAVSLEGKFKFRRMHDDVTDAARAIVRTGLVDPKKVAIMGASFGGYLAVAGVAFEDGLYCCAVTECGVFDWKKQIDGYRDAINRGESMEILDEAARPGGDLANLDQISPIGHADQIHVPVLIAHGTEDNVVDVEQSRKLAKELRRRGVPTETFYRAFEGHGFYSYQDRVEFYHRVEAFLAANLGGATLTPVR